MWTKQALREWVVRHQGINQEKPLPFIPITLYRSLVDDVERALAHYQDSQDTKKFKELDKPTDRSAEMELSDTVDRSIRSQEASFSTIWLKNTESFIELARKYEGRLQRAGGSTDQLVLQNAQVRLKLFPHLRKRYPRPQAVFYTPVRLLRLANKYASSSASQGHGLLSLSNEIILMIFDYIPKDPDAGRGALALACRELATISKLVSPVYCPPSLVAKMGPIHTRRNHRFCHGCNHMRPTRPFDWASHSVSVLDLWYENNSTLSAHHAAVRQEERRHISDSVRRWSEGEPHSHGPEKGFDGSFGPVTQDIEPCVLGHAFKHEETERYKAHPLCPPCAARHGWEVRQKVVMRHKPEDHEWVQLDRVYTGLLHALWWRRAQFLEVYPKERAFFARGRPGERLTIDDVIKEREGERSAQ